MSAANSMEYLKAQTTDESIKKHQNPLHQAPGTVGMLRSFLPCFSPSYYSNKNLLPDSPRSSWYQKLIHSYHHLEVVCTWKARKWVETFYPDIIEGQWEDIVSADQSHDYQLYLTETAPTKILLCKTLPVVPLPILQSTRKTLVWCLSIQQHDFDNWKGMLL